MKLQGDLIGEVAGVSAAAAASTTAGRVDVLEGAGADLEGPGEQGAVSLE